LEGNFIPGRITAELIYLCVNIWVYIGLFYPVDISDDNEYIIREEKR
jgi:hypothetical protein